MTEPYIDECSDMSRMENELSRLRTVEGEHKLVTGERDRLLLERARLYVRIGDLEKQLAACAAGPWREPTDEDMAIYMRCFLCERNDDDPWLHAWIEHGEVKALTEVRPPDFNA